MPWTGLNNGCLFLTILEVGKDKIKAWQSQSLMMACILLHGWMTSRSHVSDGSKQLSGDPIIMAHKSTVGPTHSAYLSPNAITWRVSIYRIT
jgi:hypothetical protein